MAVASNLSCLRAISMHGEREEKQIQQTPEIGVEQMKMSVLMMEDAAVIVTT